MYEGIWQAVLAEIEVSVSRASFITWFRNTSLIKGSDDSFTITVPNIFAKQQLEVKYADTIISLLEKNGIQPKSISYTITSSTNSAPRSGSATVSLPQPSANNASASTPSRAPSVPVINEKYNFENFIVGSGNEFAYAACQAIASGTVSAAAMSRVPCHCMRRSSVVRPR